MNSGIVPNPWFCGVSAGVSVVRRSFGVVVAVLFALGSIVRGQCHSWDPSIGQVSPNDSAGALLVVPDGSGVSILAGGYFGPPHVAKWNGTGWGGIGNLGVVGDAVLALEMYDSGSGPELYAGGTIHLPPPPNVSPAWGLFRWTGATWMQVGAGLPATVRALEVYQVSGSEVLVAGGSFLTYGAGFNWAHRIAAWNGSSWSKMGSNTVGGGFADGEVLALTVWDGGQGPELYAGGTFTMADGTPAGGIARWNGTSWSDVGSHPPYAITDFAIFDNGMGPALYAAGGFRIWRFDGSTWSEIACFPSPGGISKLAVFDDGDGPAIFVGGNFTQIGGISASRLARFDGFNWAPVGEGIPAHLPGLNGQIDALGVYDDGTRSELVVSGRFDSVGALTVRCFAGWRACSTPVDTLCFGDGTTRACPCGNQGAVGRGCAWHNGPAGAELAASGSPASDDVLLTASGMPLSAPSTVFLKGDQLLDTPTTFGDGLRCVSGTLIRLGTKINVNGAAQYPTAGNAPVSTRGGTPPGSGMIGYYQTWYRNAAVYCAPETYNVTNGVRIVW